MGAAKEGALKYKSHDAYFGFGAPVWKEGYFLLRFVWVSYLRVRDGVLVGC